MFLISGELFILMKNFYLYTKTGGEFRLYNGKKRRLYRRILGFRKILYEKA